MPNTDCSPVIRMSVYSVRCSNRGTSLVEVLVVMVVLLVGIMTVVQMFPTGFRVVRAAESRTIAAKLAEREIERWKNSVANLPTGILPIDDRGVVLNDQLPGPPFAAFQQNPDGSWAVGEDGAFMRGNVLNIRLVHGETTPVPVGSYFQTGGGTFYGSQYTLAFSPIDAYQEADGSLVGITVKSGDLRRRRGDRDFFPPYLRAGQYAIDYGDQETAVLYVAFPSSAGGDRYYLRYSYWIEESGELRLQSVLDHAIDVPPAYNGDWIPVNIDLAALPAGASFVEVESDSDSCARGFRPLQPDPGTGAVAWSDDPYEFVLADSLLGVIAFNPTGHGKFEYTARGVRPLEARIDYRIYDPRIIREDRVIPRVVQGASGIPVKLSLRFILDAGRPGVYTDGDPTDNPDEPTFEGLMRAETVGGVRRPRIGRIATEAGDFYVDRSMLIIDLSTGLRVDMANVSIDYTRGIVFLPPVANLVNWQGVPLADTRDVDLPGRHLRFFYRADGDWSVQCNKAYEVYARDWGAGAQQPDYCHYKLVHVPNTGFARRLSFAACEAGKNVTVDYTYVVGGVKRKVSGENHRISEFADSLGRHYFDLRVPDDGVVDRIYAVVGTSFKVRTIWRDGSGWRFVDMDTNLTRASSRQ